VSRYDRIQSINVSGCAVSALLAGATMVRCGERDGQRRSDRREGPAAFVHRLASNLEGRRPRDSATPDAYRRAPLAEERERGVRELWPVGILAGHQRAMGEIRRSDIEV